MAMNGFTRRGLLAAGAALPMASRGRAQGRPVLRIGVLNDQSGAYRTNGGPGSVANVRLAVQEIAAVRGLEVEVLVADHQGRPDVGLNAARQWFDRDGVDVVMDFQNSAIALAVAGLAREKDRIAIACNVGASDLTGARCSPNTLHWAYDTQMLARVTGGAQVRAGNDTWFFITADYAFGHALENDTGSFVRAAGGRVLGSVRMPFPGTDFASPLLRAQQSRAKVIGFANAGTDTVNCIKQSAEFGITRRGQKLAGLLLQINDIHALDIETAQGLTLAESFYWDLNDRTRGFARRIGPAMGGVMPNMSQAACYASVLHYLKTAAEMGVAEAKRSGAATVARMKATPAEDDVFGRSMLREDGRVLHTAYLFEVKAPSESRGPWDYYKLVAAVPPEEAFRPLAEGGCTMPRAG
ncbi:ABC transporter substrate-binding protein [Roseomonas hellenica]|uniref:ABC transporter substrate-binding protein n=2 Tax=Plastoroseomonas hellenica TaxID=2687306 RepID=A0ABS5EY61_9PROT|nr:ABC transporter substrate-binding protein [Plastoroseomonas hellenica]MBR0665229.1 ABC transporter substrate-binding protein [Plastoroseomonas hellenica]